MGMLPQAAVDEALVEVRAKAEAKAKAKAAKWDKPGKVREATDKFASAVSALQLKGESDIATFSPLIGLTVSDALQISSDY